jgi:hypothetical protein
MDTQAVTVDKWIGKMQVEIPAENSYAQAGSNILNETYSQAVKHFNSVIKGGSPLGKRYAGLADKERLKQIDAIAERFASAHTQNFQRGARYAEYSILAENTKLDTGWLLNDQSMKEVIKAAQDIRSMYGLSSERVKNMIVVLPQTYKDRAKYIPRFADEIVKVMSPKSDKNTKVHVAFTDSLPILGVDQGVRMATDSQTHFSLRENLTNADGTPFLLPQDSCDVIHTLKAGIDFVGRDDARAVKHIVGHNPHHSVAITDIESRMNMLLIRFGLHIDDLSRTVARLAVSSFEPQTLGNLIDSSLFIRDEKDRVTVIGDLVRHGCNVATKHLTLNADNLKYAQRALDFFYDSNIKNKGKVLLAEEINKRFKKSDCKLPDVDKYLSDTLSSYRSNFIKKILSDKPSILREGSIEKKQNQHQGIISKKSTDRSRARLE